MRRLALMTLLLGCPSAPGEEPPPTPVEPPPYTPTDVTFVAMGDPQYGGGASDKNTFQVQALNLVDTLTWPEGTPWAGEPVGAPRGVLIAGDLTQNGQDGRITPLDSDELGFFETDYGLTGSDSDLRWPVYEGFGNHDLDPAGPGEFGPFDWEYHYEGGTPSADRVAERNPDRVGLTHVAPDLDAHYSWDWDWLHLVNCDVFPGDEPSPVDPDALSRDPRRSLSFLEEDLATHVGDSGRPVIVMAHYGFDGFGQQERWWTDAQKEAYFAAVAPYRVVAFLHGHTHATSHYEIEGTRVLNVGSPYYTEYNQDGRGHFTLMRVTDEHLVAVDVAWSIVANAAVPTIDSWVVVDALEAP